MEYIDILDEVGNKTGIVKERDEVHKCGDWHKSAQLWIINKNGKVLLQKRGPNVKKHPNMWHISASGHIPSGHTAIRDRYIRSK